MNPKPDQLKHPQQLKQLKQMNQTRRHLRVRVRRLRFRSINKKTNCLVVIHLSLKKIIYSPCVKVIYGMLAEEKVVLHFVVQTMDVLY